MCYFGFILSPPIVNSKYLENPTQTKYCSPPFPPPCLLPILPMNNLSHFLSGNPNLLKKNSSKFEVLCRELNSHSLENYHFFYFKMLVSPLALKSILCLKWRTILSHWSLLRKYMMSRVQWILHYKFKTLRSWVEVMVYMPRSWPHPTTTMFFSHTSISIVLSYYMYLLDYVHEFYTLFQLSLTRVVKINHLPHVVKRVMPIITIFVVNVRSSVIDVLHRLLTIKGSYPRSHFFGISNPLYVCQTLHMNFISPLGYP